MTSLYFHRWLVALFGVVCATALHAQTSEFTYQGQLNRNGAPAVGLHDLRFELFDAASDGASLGTVTKTAVQVSAGLFTVVLDFGPNIFDGADRWLEVGVRPNGDAGFTVLAPRTMIHPAPYAIRAENSPGRAPVGAVVDWWRPSPATPVPAGYQVCDGSMVNDPESPMNGQVLPDLRGRFVMGSPDGTSIGESGGNTSHAHTVDIDHNHPARLSSSAGSHTHSVDVPALGGPSASTDPAGAHQHAWVEWYQGVFYSWNSSGSNTPMVFWSGSNGVGNEGSGYYPICDQNPSIDDWYTEGAGSHLHGFSDYHDHPSIITGSSSTHSHSIDLPSLGTQDKNSTETSNLPPFHGLLKIIRIK